MPSLLPSSSQPMGPPPAPHAHRALQPGGSRRCSWGLRLWEDSGSDRHGPLLPEGTSGTSGRGGSEADRAGESRSGRVRVRGAWGPRGVPRAGLEGFPGSADTAAVEGVTCALPPTRPKGVCGAGAGGQGPPRPYPGPRTCLGLCVGCSHLHWVLVVSVALPCLLGCFSHCTARSTGQSPATIRTRPTPGD